MAGARLRFCDALSGVGWLARLLALSSAWTAGRPSMRAGHYAGRALCGHAYFFPNALMNLPKWPEEEVLRKVMDWFLEVWQRKGKDKLV